MPQRRANDAQVERLLQAMRRLEYRQALARRVSSLKPDTKLPAKGTSKRRAYDSAMRRFERYVAAPGKQQRSFTAASAVSRKPIIVAARRVPLPAIMPERALPREVAPRFVEPTRPRPEFFQEIPPSPLPSRYEPPEFWETDLYDLRAVLAYYDGDADEAAEQLAGAGGDYSEAQEARMAKMLELAASGVDVLAMRGAGALSDAYRDLISTLDPEDVQDIEDFSSLLHDLPDWQIEMIIADMKQGDTTFADWMDAWHDAGMDIDNDENEYWRLWREAYARVKK